MPLYALNLRERFRLHNIIETGICSYEARCLALFKKQQKVKWKEKLAQAKNLTIHWNSSSDVCKLVWTCLWVREALGNRGVQVGGGRTGRLLRASKAGGSQRVKLQKLHFIQMLQLDVSSYCKGKHVMHGYDGNLPEGGMQMYVEWPERNMKHCHSYLRPYTLFLFPLLQILHVTGTHNKLGFNQYWKKIPFSWCKNEVVCIYFPIGELI